MIFDLSRPFHQLTRAERAGHNSLVVTETRFCGSNDTNNDREECAGSFPSVLGIGKKSKPLGKRTQKTKCVRCSGERTYCVGAATESRVLRRL